MSVMVLCSFWVPNWLAVVEKVLPTWIGPSVSLTTARPCPDQSLCFVKSLTYA